MAHGNTNTFFDGDVILNRLNITLAKRQGLLASLVGSSLEAQPEQKGSPKVLEHEEDGFSADPELLGIGGKIPDRAEVDRHKTSSNDDLKRQLLGKDYEKRQRAKQGLRGNEPTRTAQALAAVRTGRYSRPLHEVEVDSEEDTGRSSLGKRKKYRAPTAEVCALRTEEAVEPEERVPLSDNEGQPNSTMVFSSSRPKGDVYSIPAQQASSKRKKKKKKKKKNQKHRTVQ